MTELMASPPGTVLIEGEKAFLTFQRRLPHPREEVWAALTDPAELAVWCFTEAKIDARKGGSIDMRAGPGRVHIKGRILEWDPPRLFEYEWKIAPQPGMPNGEDAVLRWELVAEGEETVLTTTHRNVSRRTALGVGPAQHMLLDRLAARLARVKLPGFERLDEIARHYAPWSDEDIRPWLRPPE